MAGTELMVVKAVGEAVAGLVQSYKSNNAISRMRKVQVEEAITAYRANLRARAVGTITRENINQIICTMSLIDGADLSGVPLKLVMQQLESLNVALQKNLEDYSNGY